MIYKAIARGFSAFIAIALFIAPSSIQNCYAGSAADKNFRYIVQIASFQKDEKIDYQLKILQPYSFELATIRKSMVSLGYQEKALAWSKTKRVFSNDAIQQLSPLIVEKFSQAGPNQLVSFKIAKPSGRTWTEGHTFLTAQGLHWRFTRLHGGKRKIGDFSVMGESWKLIEREGQVYKKNIRTDLNGLAQDVTNWMVLRNVRPKRSRVLKVPAPSAKEAGKSSSTEDIKRRLKTLDELKDGKFIDEDEYNKKRREILDSF